MIKAIIAELRNCQGDEAATQRCLVNLSAKGSVDLPDVAEALNSAVGAFGAQYPRAKEDRYQILRRLAGLRFEDAERMIWRAGLFKDVEDRVSKVGTGTICVKMNEYAKRHADESAP